MGDQLEEARRELTLWALRAHAVGDPADEALHRAYDTARGLAVVRLRNMGLAEPYRSRVETELRARGWV